MRYAFVPEEIYPVKIRWCLFDNHLTVDHGIQQLVFRAQLDLALRLMKPICLHIREADDDALQIMAQVCIIFQYYVLSIQSNIWNIILL